MLNRSQRCRATRRVMAFLVLLQAAAMPGGNAIAADVVSLELTLLGQGDRPVPVTASYPTAGCDGCRMVVFSHGANAAPERYPRISDAWAAAGFLVVAPLHVDSELNPTRDQYDAGATMLTRLEDFAMLANGVALREALARHNLFPQEQVIAAGHSYGALIAQLAGGATLKTIDPLPDALLAAQELIIGVVALSPPGPFAGTMAADNWATVERPMLVVTGTTDILPGFMDDWRMHLVSFEAAQRAPAYALVFAGQDHYFNGAFGRPREQLTEATEEALRALNAHTVQFMQALDAGTPPAASTWLALDRAGVEALVSDYTAGRQTAR